MGGCQFSPGSSAVFGETSSTKKSMISQGSPAVELSNEGRGHEVHVRRPAARPTSGSNR